MKEKALNCRSRSNVMKLSFILLALLLSACAPANMVKKDARLDIRTVKPEPGKAALVIARTTSLGGAINFFNYIDHKFIGVTRGKGCFVKKDIAPGLQYLIARTESLETGKLQFEPDTVYYVQESPRIGWVVARVTMTPMTPDQLFSEIGDKGCEEYVIDSNNIAEDLTEHEYQEAVTDYEREVKEGHHTEFTEYKGFKIQR